MKLAHHGAQDYQSLLMHKEAVRMVLADASLIEKALGHLPAGMPSPTPGPNLFGINGCRFSPLGTGALPWRSLSWAISFAKPPPWQRCSRTAYDWPSSRRSQPSKRPRQNNRQLIQLLRERAQ